MTVLSANLAQISPIGFAENVPQNRAIVFEAPKAHRDLMRRVSASWQGATNFDHLAIIPDTR